MGQPNEKRGKKRKGNVGKKGKGEDGERQKNGRRT
jgi:hypothetical protein